MLGPLIVCYLFLGGTGAGACLVLAALGLLAPGELVAVRGAGGDGAGRRPAGAHAVLRPPAAYRRLLAPGYRAALVALALGMVCLLADVGRADRLLLLLTSPALSHVAVGAWSLAVCAVLAVLAALAWDGLVRRWRFAAVQVLQAALALAALAVMLYTGLLLQSLSAVPLWATPWLPVLFTLSSLSCGIAVVLVAAFFADPEGEAGRIVRPLVRADAALIVLEAAAAALFAGLALAGGHPGTAASAAQLVDGSGAPAWWGGFVLCGLAVPLAVELAFAVRERSQARALQPVLRTALAVAAVLVLVGGFSMRSAIVDAGMHRDLELEEPSAQALRLE